MRGNFAGGAMRKRARARAPFQGEGTARDQELMLLKRKLVKVEQERDAPF